MLRVHCFLIVCGVALSSQAQYTATVKTTTTKGSASWKNWRGEAFTINHPEDWLPESSALNGVPVTFLGPLDSASTIREQVTVRVEEAGTSTPAEIAKRQEDQIKQINGKFKASNTSTVNEETESKVDEQGNIILEYTTGPDSLIVRHLRHIHIAGGKAWIIEFSGSEQDHADHLYLVETMFASFRLKEEKEK